MNIRLSAAAAGVRAVAAAAVLWTWRLILLLGSFARAWTEVLRERLRSVPSRHWREAAVLGAGAGLAVFFTFAAGSARPSFGILAESFKIADTISQMAAAGAAGLAPVEPQPDAATLGSVLKRLGARGADGLAPTVRALTVVLKPGDTLSSALARAGAPMSEIERALVALGGKLDLRRLRPGQKIKMEIAHLPGTNRLSHDRSGADTGASRSATSGTALASAPARINSLAVLASYDRRVVVSRDGDAFNAESEGLAVTPMTMARSGTISGSLYYSALKAGVPEAVIVDFIRIFSYEVDFQRDIQPGDKFTVLYNLAVVPDTGQAPSGPVLYGSLDMGGRTVELFRHEEPSGEVEYFKPDGKSVRQLLMKTPIDGARLSSSFGMRFHPVLGYSRMHKGVDFAAGTGTPIYAAGNGTLVRIGPASGFGNYIRIRHAGGYDTAYGHMSRFAAGMRPGVRVRQGQVIGYVGKTGLASGPHLHYEVLQKNAQVNPLKLRFASGRTLSGKALSGFRALNATRLASLGRILWASGKMAESAREIPGVHREEAR